MIYDNTQHQTSCHTFHPPFSSAPLHARTAMLHIRKRSHNEKLPTIFLAITRRYPALPLHFSHSVSPDLPLPLQPPHRPTCSVFAPYLLRSFFAFGYLYSKRIRSKYVWDTTEIGLRSLPQPAVTPSLSIPVCRQKSGQYISSTHPSSVNKQKPRFSFPLPSFTPTALLPAFFWKNSHRCRNMAYPCPTFVSPSWPQPTVCPKQA